MRILDLIMSVDTEKLRRELCLWEYKEANEEVTKIKAKFKEIESMMDKQLEVHLRWDS